MRLPRSVPACCSLVFVSALAAVVSSARAQSNDPAQAPPDPKTVTMIIGYPTGGGVDATGRLFAQFLTKYLPGNPPVIVRNMPGADGRIGLNFFVRNAKPDGLMINNGSGSQLDPMAYRVPTALYDPTKFHFVGGISRGGTFQVISKNSEARLLDKAAPPVPIGAVDGSRSGEQMTSWGMELLGWNAKWVVGYRSANETSVALERGEVDIVSTSNSFLILRLLDTGKFKLLSQSGVVLDGKLRRRTDFSDIPVMSELVDGKLTTKGARDAFKYFEAICAMGPWLALPPDTPEPIVAMYRGIFPKIMADPEFQEKAKRISEDIALMTHSDIAELVKTAAERLTPDAEEFIRAMHIKQGLVAKGN